MTVSQIAIQTATRVRSVSDCIPIHLSITTLPVCVSDCIPIHLSITTRSQVKPASAPPAPSTDAHHPCPPSLDHPCRLLAAARSLDHPWLGHPCHLLAAAIGDSVVSDISWRGAVRRESRTRRAAQGRQEFHAARPRHAAAVTGRTTPRARRRTTPRARRRARTWRSQGGGSSCFTLSHILPGKPSSRPEELRERGRKQWTRGAGSGARRSARAQGFPGWTPLFLYTHSPTRLVRLSSLPSLPARPRHKITRRT